jgi:hypothetical protein
MLLLLIVGNYEYDVVRGAPLVGNVRSNFRQNLSVVSKVEVGACAHPPLLKKVTSKLAQAVNLVTCIHKVPGSNPGRDTDRSNWYFAMVFLSPFRQMR